MADRAPSIIVGVSVDGSRSASEETVRSYIEYANSLLDDFTDLASSIKDIYSVADIIEGLHDVWSTRGGDAIIGKTEEEAKELDKNKLASELSTLANERFSYSKMTIDVNN